MTATASASLLFLGFGLGVCTALCFLLLVAVFDPAKRRLRADVAMGLLSMALLSGLAGVFLRSWVGR
jgi:hypothetical protein